MKKYTTLTVWVGRVKAPSPTFCLCSGGPPWQASNVTICAG